MALIRSRLTFTARIGLVPVLVASLMAPLPVAAQAAAPDPGLGAADAQQSGDGLSPARFADPPSDSRPTVLWFWNGRMTPELVDQQMAAMRREGIDEAIIFPRGDDPHLQPAFFSEAWFDIVGHALGEAKRTGMHLWLFNDDYFPSGRAASLVLRGGRVGDRVYEPQPHLRPQEVTRLGSRLVSGSSTVNLSLDTLLMQGFRVQDGVLHVDAEAGGGGGIALLRSGGGWQDYTVEYDLTVRRNAAGLVVRAKDTKNGYLVDHGASGVVNIYRQQNDALTRIGTGQASGITPEAARQVRVRVQGSRIEVSVNGALVAAATDATWATGSLGPRVVSNQIADFDNFAVTGADGATLYRETFDSAAAVDAFDASPFLSKKVDHADIIGVSAIPVRDGQADLAGVVDLTERFRRGEPWDAPAGQFRLEYFQRTYLNMTGLYNNYLDLMNPEAVNRYVDVIHAEYLRRFPWAFGTVLRGFWDDEPANPAEWGKLAWSDVLPGELAEQGVSPAQVLPALFAEYGRAGRTAKGQYRRAVADGLANYYRLSGEWAEQHGVALLSNPYTDHFGPSGAVKWGDTYKNDQWFQVPGADAVFNQVLPGRRSVIPRYPVSSGHQMGRERIAAELLGAYGWGVTPELSRYVTGYMAVRGVNLSILHAYWSDPTKVKHPPPFQPENTWYDALDGLSIWTGRLMEAGLGQGAAPTAVLHPQRAAEAWIGTTTGQRLDRDFQDVIVALEDVQVDLDTLDEANLDGDPAMRRQAVPRDGALRIGLQAYRMVVVPPTPMLSLEVVHRLTELVRQGGTVVAVDELPAEETQGRDAELASALAELFGVDPAAPSPRTRDLGAGTVSFVTSAEQLQEKVRAAGVPAAELNPANTNVRVLRTQRGSDTVFLVFNEGDRPVESTATFPASGVPELWDPDTGSAATAPVFHSTQGGKATSLPMRLEPFESQVVVFDTAGSGVGGTPHLVHSPFEASSVRQLGTNAIAAEVEVTSPGEHTLLGQSGGRLYRGAMAVADELRPTALSGSWRFRFDRDGANWTTRPLGSWIDIDPRYSGRGVYETTFELSAADLADGRRFRLDLGQVRDVAEVEVNGRHVGRALWRPYQVDVTGALRLGANQVTVRVTNTNANEKGTAQVSGLLGPVVLRPYRVERVRLDHVPGAVADDGLVAVTAAPATLDLGGCGTGAMTATVYNFGPRKISGELSIAAPEGVTAFAPEGPIQVPARGSVDIPVKVVMRPGAAEGLIAFGFKGQTASVSVVADGSAHSNLARSGAISASSTHDRFSAASVIDGSTDSRLWDAGDGWNDATLQQFPDWLQVQLPCERTVGRIDLYTLDSTQFPAARFGIRDADLQVLVDGEWQTVRQVRGNTAGLIRATFDPVRTSAVRVVIHASNDGGHSRIIELEVYAE